MNSSFADQSDIARQFDFRNKLCLVTGGGSGIGAVIGAAFARAGGRVIVADVNPAAAEQTAALIRSEGGHSVPAELDVRCQHNIDVLLESLAPELGAPDVLFNAAGIMNLEPFGAISRGAMEDVFSVNVIGLFLVMQSVAARMANAGKCGSIVNVASVAGRRGTADGLAYSASKAAVISLTQGASQALAPKGIRVNAIAPGPMKTPMWQMITEVHGQGRLGLSSEKYEEFAASRSPMKRIGTAEDLIGTVLFLSSPASQYIVGQTINVDGGAILN
jgi:D-sorbitol dehydrogenase (acceptor)